MLTKCESTILWTLLDKMESIVSEDLYKRTKEEYKVITEKIISIRQVMKLNDELKENEE